MDRPVNLSQPSLKKVHFLSGPDIQIRTGAVSATSRKRCSLSRSTLFELFSSVLLARNALLLCFLFNEFLNFGNILVHHELLCKIPVPMKISDGL
jgi:hypothetical protein